MNGIGNNRFAPDNTLTYAQFYAMIVPVFAGGDFYASAYDKGPEWYAPYMDMGIVDFPTHAAWVDMNYSRHYADAGLDSWRPVYLKYANQPITRAEAISIMWWVLTFEELTDSVSGADTALAQIVAENGSLNVWDEVPVSVCYAAGLISGDQNGKLNLNSTLTRAEGCAMLCNLVDYVTGHGHKITTGTDFEDLGRTVWRDWPAPAGWDRASSNPTQQTPGSDGTSTVYTLKNGKPITEENVIEMLKEIEKQYPSGSPWSADPDSPHNPNPVSETLLNHFPAVSATYACGGFAAMVSDMIFPPECEARILTDFSKVRPGDIAFDAYRDKYGMILVTHVWVALGPCVHSDMVTGPEEAEWMIVGRADGNMGGKISWGWPNFDEIIQKYNGWTPVYPEGTAPIVPDESGGYQAPFQYFLTRYPD